MCVSNLRLDDTWSRVWFYRNFKNEKTFQYRSGQLQKKLRFKVKTKTADLISIIIPYYKKTYINKTIESILTQSYQNFEIILIYDDETFSDLDFIKEISKNDKRINLLINEKSFGAGLSRNKGIKFSKGNFIAFIDSDDVWHKTKLENK